MSDEALEFDQQDAENSAMCLQLMISFLQEDLPGLKKSDPDNYETAQELLRQAEETFEKLTDDEGEPELGPMDFFAMLNAVEMVLNSSSEQDFDDPAMFSQLQATQGRLNEIVEQFMELEGDCEDENCGHQH